MFQNATVIAENTLPKPKTEPSFNIVNVHHGISKDETRHDFLNINRMQVSKISRVIIQTTRQPTKLKRVVTENYLI